MNKPLTCLTLGIAGVVTLFAHQLSGTTGGAGQGGSGSIPRPPTGSWAPLTHQPPPNGGNDYFTASEMFLMTDGSVLVMAADTSFNVNTQSYFSDPSVWKLTPDNTGSYTNGTWTQMASMHDSRLYFGSSVLADGRLLVAGGEYADGSTATVGPVWTNACEIYDPATNVWTKLTPPNGGGGNWSQIGDAPGVVLPNGTFIMGNDFGTDTAYFTPSSNSWLTGPSIPGADGSSDEEAWALMPNNRVLAVNCDNHPDSRYLSISGNDWVDIGSTPSDLVDPSSFELGPSMLLPNGNVFQMGASALSKDGNGNLLPNSCIYNPTANSWSLGPPNLLSGGVPLCCPDAPGCVEPNGMLLMAMSPFQQGAFVNGTHMVEYNGSALVAAPTPASASGGPAFVNRFLVLPTGQILLTSSGNSDSSGNQVFIYTPSGTYQSAWQPTISPMSGTLQQGTVNNPLSGTQLNGISQGSSYGDDSTNFTNYPIVRIQNVATGHVFYCKTHNHSTMGVATGSTVVSTQFDIPAGTEIGPSNLYVVANGIPSLPQVVNVVEPHVVLPTGDSLYRGLLNSGSLASLFFADGNVLDVLTGPTLSSLEAPVQVIVTGISPTLTPTSFKFTVISKVNTTGTNQVISLWNYSTSKYDVLDTRSGTTSNQTVTVTASGTLSHYVSGTGTVQARIAASQTGPTLLYQWGVSIDLANWTIQ